ncbi:hypothetical protein Taro_048071 [Colocasia esculenta]|uniref:GDT1 family protein n=1 Tax=Colocasia esculenta TaxID=4460 RepID=A0A843X837_COLES|nr:hypothetical protein [Colocasia esculenta]
MIISLLKCDQTTISLEAFGVTPNEETNPFFLIASTNSISSSLLTSSSSNLTRANSLRMISPCILPLIGSLCRTSPSDTASHINSVLRIFPSPLSRIPYPLSVAGVLLGCGLAFLLVAFSKGGPSALVAALAKSGFTAAFTLIFVSEIGDKTFFIAALLAMQYQKALVLLGSMGALALMTILSVVIGRIFHAVPSQFQTKQAFLAFQMRHDGISYGTLLFTICMWGIGTKSRDDIRLTANASLVLKFTEQHIDGRSSLTALPIGEYAAVALLIYFGFKSIKNAWELPPDDGKKSRKGPELGELVEAEELVKEKVAKKLTSPFEIVSKSFSLVFFAVSSFLFASSSFSSAQQHQLLSLQLIKTMGRAVSKLQELEWGDRSMLATIALGAAQSPWGVASGAIAGHLVATSFAVLGGAFLANYISEKLVGYLGGVLFLIFAVATLLGVF